MLDLSVYKTRYYEVKVDDNLTVNLEMPKKKQLKTIMSLTKSLNGDVLSETDIDSLYDATLIAFNKNKEGKHFTEDDIEEMLGFNSLYAFFDGYYSWVADNINQKN